MASSLRPSTSSNRARSSSPAGHSGYWLIQAVDHLAGFTKLRAAGRTRLAPGYCGPEELPVAAVGPFHLNELLPATLDFGRLLLFSGQFGIGEQQIEVAGTEVAQGIEFRAGLLPIALGKTQLDQESLRGGVLGGRKLAHTGLDEAPRLVVLLAAGGQLRREASALAAASRSSPMGNGPVGIVVQIEPIEGQGDRGQHRLFSVFSSSLMFR